MSQSLDRQRQDQMYAAEGKGYSFIKLLLNRKKVSRGQKEVIFKGVKRLKAYSTGASDDGVKDYEFVVQGGNIIFQRDARERAYVGYMFDDGEKAYHSKKGWNRDVLATHIGDFIIQDKEVEADVKKRAEFIKDKLAKEASKPKEPELKVDPETDLDDLQKQIDFLKARKAKVEKQIKSNTTRKRPATRRTSSRKLSNLGEDSSVQTNQTVGV